jgi:serine/threonine protein kinase
MEGKSKLTKEVVAQEARFILDSLISAGQYNKEVPVEELRRLCEQSVSLRLLDYINFLERFGYLTYDRNTHVLSITADGERVVGGEKVAELVIDVVHHFRPILARARKEEAPAPAAAQQPRPRRTSGGKRDLIDGRYEKMKTIGSGGIGTVHLARQVMLDRAVAIKEIRELFGFFTEPQRQEIIKRFDEEVRKSAKLTHPNIATILDGNTSQEYPYFVSEYIGGGNLRRIISRAESIPPELTIKIFLQLLHALGHAHGKKVIHRGLKPENILFDSSGNVRVTDFGMARVVERDQAVIQHVYVGMGSVAYMAPELFNDPSKVGPQTDLYALGILLYEMLARKLPGRRAPMPTKLHPKLPKVIDDIFDRLTQDDRDARYKSVDEVFEDFHKADASKEFLEPRGAVLFLDNPLNKLKLKPEEPEEPAKEEGEAQKKAPEQTTDDVGAVPLDSPPAAASHPPRASQPPRASTKEGMETPPISKGDGSGPKPLAPEPVDPPPVDETSPEAETAVTGGDQAEDEEQGEDDGERPKRRSRVQRPYSFQQRIKDRDK